MLRHVDLDYLYMVYRGSIIGYGVVDRILTRSATMPVGTKLQPVKPGHSVIINDAYQRMPPMLRSVQVRGFTAVRCTSANLHKITPKMLRAELKAAGVIVY
jgi:hypothetical protein